MEKTLFEEKYISAMDGKKIYTRLYGDFLRSEKTPIFCLSGLVRTADDFHDFALGCVAQGFPVVAMDYRGRGRSDFDDQWEHYRGQYIVGDIMAVLNACHIQQAIFVGTSFGGILSMVINMIQPVRVKAVVTNDVGPAFGTSGLSRIREYVGTDNPQKSWDQAVLSLKEMFTTIRLKDDDAWMSMAKGTFKEGDDGLLHIRWDTNIAKTIGLRPSDPDLWRIFGTLKQTPMLAIRGSISDVLTQETFEKMQEIKPDLIPVLVEGVGHCPMYDEPAVLEKLIPFLDQVA